MKNEYEPFKNEYEFHPAFFTIKTYLGNNLVGSSEIIYKDLIKFKVTPNYYFLYENKDEAYPISKNQLDNEQRNFIEKMIVFR